MNKYTKVTKGPPASVKQWMTMDWPLGQAHLNHVKSEGKLEHKLYLVLFWPEHCRLETKAL